MIMTMIIIIIIMIIIIIIDSQHARGDAALVVGVHDLEALQPVHATLLQRQTETQHLHPPPTHTHTTSDS
jgi:hypothetical protein